MDKEQSFLCFTIEMIVSLARYVTVRRRREYLWDFVGSGELDPLPLFISTRPHPQRCRNPSIRFDDRPRRGLAQTTVSHCVSFYCSPTSICLEAGYHSTNRYYVC